MKRKGPRVDKSALAIGVPLRVRDPKHLKWISTLPCVITNFPGPNDPAHISHQNGKGMALKVGDNNVLPLAHSEHLRQHSQPEHEFWGKDLARAKKLANDLYEITGQTTLAVFRIFQFQRGE